MLSPCCGFAGFHIFILFSSFSHHSVHYLLITVIFPPPHFQSDTSLCAVWLCFRHFFRDRTFYPLKGLTSSQLQCLDSFLTAQTCCAHGLKKRYSRERTLQSCSVERHALHAALYVHDTFTSTLFCDWKPRDILKLSQHFTKTQQTHANT